MGAVKPEFSQAHPGRCRSGGRRVLRETRCPGAKMLRYDPFRRLLIAVIGWSVAYGGMTAFTVGLSEGRSRHERRNASCW